MGGGGRGGEWMGAGTSRTSGRWNSGTACGLNGRIGRPHLFTRRCGWVPTELLRPTCPMWRGCRRCSPSAPVLFPPSPALSRCIAFGVSPRAPGLLAEPRNAKADAFGLLGVQDPIGESPSAGRCSPLRRCLAVGLGPLEDPGLTMSGRMVGETINQSASTEKQA